MLTRKFTYSLMFLLAPVLLFAQVTTSRISGTVVSGTNAPLTGATIKATHQPTGTVFAGVSATQGIYNIVNLIPGGPYRIEVSFVGYQNVTQDSIFLALGENTRVDLSLSTTSSELSSVVVAGVASSASSRRKTGASTSISRTLINNLPTLSRNIIDYVRLTPQANGGSLGGANNRFNNITIDGAVNNDVFGLSGSGTPGGQAGTTPISLDAIQEIQVVLAPYDITYGNFTGGGVNAITRSGSNKFEGSVYGFLRNQGTVGSDPVTKIKTLPFKDKQYGARLGGAIVKNKLFFFVNAELARRSAPTIFNAGDASSLLSKAEAQAIVDTLKRRYNYDAGTYDAYAAETQSDKYFARIDWNISDKHRLTLRHNYIKAYDDNISRSNTLFRFGNNGYRFNNKQNITVAELRSRFSNTLSNNLIVGVHKIRDYRSTFGQLFPFIEISKGSANNGIQIGSERSSVANELDQDIFEVTDNLKIFKGKHTFTLGTHNEFFKFRNLFISNLNGRWTFANIDSFNKALPNEAYGVPRQVQVTYSNIAGDARPSAKFSAAQLGFYGQDEIQFNNKLRLTVGLRVDIPVIGDQPGYNRAVDSTYKGVYNTSTTNSGQLLWSPRVGFNYDITGKRKYIVRGGAGIFSGRLPFVWISNQFSNNGLFLNTISVADDTRTPNFNEVNNNRGFQADPNLQTTVGATAARTYEVNLIENDFKFPQVARFNLATDITLPGGILATFEGIYSKTLNNILYQDVNLTAPVGIVDQAYNNGADKRIAYATSNNGRRINPSITNAILLKNTDEGYSYNLTAQFSKTWKHVYASVAYNHNDSKEPNSGSSSTALSNYSFNQVVGDPNNPGTSRSNYALKHRFTGALSFNFDYAKAARTNISFFYEGRSGSYFTYLVNGDLNSDAFFGNDLLYVPRNASEIKFVDLVVNNQVAVTAADQLAAFSKYVDGDDYLSGRKGNYTERNGSHTPWEHVVDVRISQDFYVITRNKTKHTLQITADMFNFTNLLNRNWGRQYFVANQAYSILTAVNRTSGAFIGKGYNYTPGQLPWNVGFGSRFQGQIGLRYSFN